ncbi:MAG: M20/M25/M40 family metallo-hydrolase [Elusimicrobiales bacterium]|nr:M20/M25/M40 family metallo-hydrolase [Elusimicrobiales bacterium]
MKKGLLFVCLFAVCAAVRAQDAADDSELKAHLINLVNIKTAQPEGNETEAARYIYRVLSRENIDWAMYRAADNRANLVAVLKGSGKEKPLLLLSHLDTVGADPQEWSVPPFRATEKDGYIYGRGASDCKSLAAIDLAVLVRLKRLGVKLRRDVIMLASADEESGGAKGLRWMIDNHWKDIASGFAINEGGGMLLDADGRPRVVFVDAAAKMYMDIKITAKGAAGHSALAPADNAIYRLGGALHKIKSYKTAARITPLTRKFFEGIYPFQDTDAKTTIDMLFSSTETVRLQAASAVALDPFFNSQIRDTVVATVLSAGSENNVVPGRASAILNCRLLPDSDPDRFAEDIKKTIADDKVEVSVIERPELPFPKPMEMNDELYSSIVRASSAALSSAALVGGVVSPSNDSEHLRRKGVTTYGFCGPATYGKASGVHGADERISEKELYQQFKLVYSVVADFAAER